MFKNTIPYHKVFRKNFEQFSGFLFNAVEDHSSRWRKIRVIHSSKFVALFSEYLGTRFGSFTLESDKKGRNHSSIYILYTASY